MSQAVRVILLALSAVGLSLGQSTLQVSVTLGGNSSSIPPGGTFPIAAGNLGQPIFVNVTVHSAGVSATTITAITLTGTSEMALLSLPVFPVVLMPGGNTNFVAEYVPSSGTSVTAQVSIAFTENNQASTFPFALVGSPPMFAYSYFIQPNGATTSVNAGDHITFPATNVGNSATASFTVANRGSAAGALQSVTIAGAGFQVSGSPAPVQLSSGQTASFNVVFTPQAAGGSQGTLSLAINGSVVTFALSGTGTAPSFTAGYTLPDGNARALANGTTISFPAADINTNTTATVTILNQGTGPGTVNGVTITGNGFRASGLPLFPAVVGVGQSVTFAIVFAPTQGGSFSGTFRIDLSGGLSISGVLTGSTAPSKMSLSYLDPATNSLIPLRDGGSLPFPNTVTGSASNVTLVVTNTGSGTGFVNAITLGSGASPTFQLLGLPTFPVTLGPSMQLTFGVRFAPQQQQAFSATLVCNLDGSLATINLSGTGTASQFTYTWSDQTNTTALLPGGSLAVANTAIGQTSSVSVSVTNTGTADNQISVLGVTGQGLSLTGVPTLPVTLHPNAPLRFTVNFTPAQPGPVTGLLTIGIDTFTVTSIGLGPQLVYSLSNSAGNTAISPAGTIVLTPAPVGSNTSAQVSIQNTGTSAATISTITIAAPSSIFILQNLPALPLSLAPGATIGFAIQFTPTDTSTATATLLINNANFTLAGTGTPPAPLPSYAFQGPNGTQQAAQQPSVGLSLLSSYPLPLSGQLKLTFVSSAFTDDPSIQFATGGRTVNFNIPANSTQALFNGGATSIPFQTGTTAGTIVITPSFALAGGFDLTPSSPAPLTLTIPASAPRLLTATVTVLSLTTFTVTLTGYTTTRTLTQLDCQLTPKAGYNLLPNRVTVDVSAPATSWFQSTVSQGFGGAFLLTLPFVLQNGSSTDDLVHLLQSLAITATNDAGTSSALMVQVQ